METDVAPPNWRELVDEDDKRIWARINRWCGHDYFYDIEAVKTPMKPISLPQYERPYEGVTGKDYAESGAQDGRDVKSRIVEGAPAGANLRNVWKIATHSFSEAHFATFPPALVEPCIKAGTSAHGVCEKCSAPWVRGIKSEIKYTQKVHNVRGVDQEGGNAGSNRSRDGHIAGQKHVETTGWSPSCQCKVRPTVPATVLDPFGGAGTVGMVAERLGRDSIIIEISPDYAAMAKRRILDDAPLLANVALE